MAGFFDVLNHARKHQKNAAANERFRQILGIIKKYDIFKGLTPEKAVSLLEELGPSFVKIGQIASTHPEMLPKEYCDAFAQLRANVVPLSAQVTRDQIEKQLGKPIDQLFSEFDDTPIGSASIAQVHKAVLKDGGRVVAVKVQRPGIVETMTNDFAIMERLVDLYDLVTHDKDEISLKELIAELERTSGEELDFTCEADNLKRFYENNKNRKGISSPQCYDDYTNAAILTEDFFDEPRAGQIETLGFSDDTRESLGYLVAHNYVEQVMKDGFYHADPHAGNILLLEDGSGIKWIDFGMMGTLTNSQRELLKDIVVAVVKGNAYNLSRYVLHIASPKGPVDHSVLLNACEEVIDEFVNVDLEDFDLAKILNSASDAMKSNGLDIQPFITNLARGLVTLEGTIRMISPKVNIMKVLMDYLQNSFSIKDVRNKMREFSASSLESMEATTSLPAQVSNALDMLQKGQMSMSGKLEVNEFASNSLTTTLNNFALVIIAAGLFLGSCILCLTNLHPLILGVPALGFFGFVCGIILMIFVVVRILRSKH